MKENLQLVNLLREIQRLPASLKAKSLETMPDEIQTALLQKFDACDDNVIIDRFGIDKAEVCKLYADEIKRYRIICQSYKSGNIGKAMQKMQEVLESNKFIPTLSFVKEQGMLFRVRKNDDYYLYDKSEMFHMPLNKTSAVGNQRYSINGFPCLYLGASIYDCWEECRRPDLEKLNVVAYKYVKSKPLKFLLIDYPKHVGELQNYKSIVLFLHCSYFSKNDKEVHKAEYVIPELVLHSLIGMKEKEDFSYDGIAYISSRFFKPACFFPSNHDLMMNYVIPIRGKTPVKVGNDEKQYDPDLVDMFRLSESKAIFTEKIRGRDFPKFHPRPTDYVNSLFHQMEQEFKRRECKFEKLV